MIDELKKLRKVSHTEDKTILRHPDGHELHIMHNSIQPHEKQSLMNAPIQHFDDGGDVKDVSSVINPPQEQNMSVDPNNPNPVLTAQNVPSQQPVLQIDPKQQVFDKLKQQYINNQQVSFSGNKFGGPDPQQLDDQATKYAETQMYGQKQAETAENDRQAANYETQIADITKRNQMRSQIGLPPLPMPTPPSGVTMPSTPTTPDQTQNIPDQTTQQIVPSGDNDPYGMQEYQNNIRSGIGAQLQGIGMEANALGAQGAQNAKMERDYINQMQNNLSQWQQRSDALEQERQKWNNDIQNNQIDPNHYINNMTTGGKIKTAIGLILGGLSGGVSGKQNPALQILNNHIDNDIRSQMANLGSKETLLSGNLRQFGNLRDATDMTRIMTGDLLAHQIQAEASQQQGPLAQARAMQTAGQIMQNNAALLQQVKMRQQFMQPQQGNAFAMGDGKINPNALPFIIQDPQERKQAQDELSKAQQLDKLKNDLDVAANVLHTKFLAGTLTPGDRASFVNTYGGLLGKLAEGRFNLDESKQQINAMLPAGLDSDNTFRDKALNRARFFDAMRSTPTLDRYNIGTGVNQIYNNQGQKNIPESPYRKASVR